MSTQIVTINVVVVVKSVRKTVVIMVIRNDYRYYMGTKQNRIQNCKKISYFYVNMLIHVNAIS